MPNPMLRSQSFVAVAATSKVLLPANARRRAALISAPAYDISGATPFNSATAAADGATVGVKQSVTGQAGKTITITQASATLAGGAAPTVAFQYFDGATNYDLVKGAAPQAWSGRIDLSFGQTVQWNVTALGAGATLNLAILGTLARFAERITLSFGRPAVLDQGVNLFYGGAPLLLIADMFGGSIMEEITFIGSTANGTVGVVEIMEG